jgi:hypothetical protein
MGEIFKGLVWSCSKVGNIMAKPKYKSELISESAKSFIESIVNYNFYDIIKTSIESTREVKNIINQTKKGIDLEKKSIKLVNDIFGTKYKKNTKYSKNDFVKGVADIVTKDLIIEIKTSWSFDSFPKIPEKAYNAIYEWQVRAYMMLYDKPNAKIFYCLIDTPDYLLKESDDLQIHKVEHINPLLRITELNYKRDLEIEEQIKQKINYANEYYIEYHNKLVHKQFKNK